jgi:hypothetical protein
MLAQHTHKYTCFLWLKQSKKGSVHTYRSYGEREKIRGGEEDEWFVKIKISLALKQVITTYYIGTALVTN